MDTQSHWVATVPPVRARGVPLIPRTVLVVIDPHAELHPGLDKAVRIAARDCCDIELFICDTPESIPDTPESALSTLHPQRRLYLARLEKLEVLARPLRAAGLSISTSAAWYGTLADGICEQAAYKHAHIVVKEAHQHSVSPHDISGSTDAALIQRLPCQLLLVRQERWPTSPRIGVAITRRERAELLEASLELAHTLHASIDIVPSIHARPPHPLPDVLVIGSGLRPDHADAAPSAGPMHLLENLGCDLLVLKCGEHACEPAAAAPVAANTLNCHY
jgi:nucleotide-binding universal stress UspA family protein